MGRAEQRPFVRVVVLNWNSAWLTSRCLRSLERTEYPRDRLDVVVVDNASIDGSLARLRHDVDWVRFIENPENLGFAEGCNRAMRDLDGVDFVALVNNDATVAPNWLEPLIDAASTAPDIGAVCPVIELEAPFVDVQLQPRAAETIVERVTVDGLDVTRRCLVTELDVRTHDYLPLELVRHLRRPATIGVPLYVGDPEHTARVTVELSVGGRIDVEERLVPLGAASVRLNSAGTALTDWCEGFEVGFGRPVDEAPTSPNEVWGWSGGGVLLRVDMLRKVGLFDPLFFAYYEDTDLAWRSRRAGWRTVVAPAARLRHMHGGSAGSTARPFFFLNYRNWLLSVLRNGTPAQRGAAWRRVAQQSLPFVRRQITGRARRGLRPRPQVPQAWLRVLVGVAESARRVRRSGPAPIGSRPEDGVVSRWMPLSVPRPPTPRPGGPLLVYVDVTETVRSGWRAGIQRVTCELVRALPEVDPDRFEIVPIVWSSPARRFRRIDGPEYEDLLAPTAHQVPDLPTGVVRPVPAWRLVAGSIGRTMRLDGFAARVRESRRRSSLSEVHGSLLLDRLEPGSVFVDIDASWNVGGAPRSVLLPELVAGGVRVVQFVHDLLPIEHPAWFESNNAELFRAHFEAHAASATVVVANSENTAQRYRSWVASRSGTPDVVGIALGADHARAEPLAPPALHLDEHETLLLIVGTIEPRKNHGLVLDAFEVLRASRPGLRLVVAGRAGWGAEDIIERLSALRAERDGVVWLPRSSDAELEWLYQRAAVVIVASEDEGYGLPAAEALARGRPLVCARRGALVELCGAHATMFDPVDGAALVDVLAPLLDDVDVLNAARSQARSWTVPAWRQFAESFAGVITAGRHGVGDEALC